MFLFRWRKMEIKVWPVKFKVRKKGIATNIARIISFSFASHFKDGIWRIYSSESLKHSWDALKSMLQARQAELEPRNHQNSSSLSSKLSNVKIEGNKIIIILSISKFTTLHFVCVVASTTPFLSLNILSAILINSQSSHCLPQKQIWEMGLNFTTFPLNLPGCTTKRCWNRSCQLEIKR